MMAESSDYIVILSEGHKSMFPQATCHPLTRKIYVAKNGINICLSGQICYLMCTGPLYIKRNSHGYVCDKGLSASIYIKYSCLQPKKFIRYVGSI